MPDKLWVETSALIAGRSSDKPGFCRRETNQYSALDIFEYLRVMTLPLILMSRSDDFATLMASASDIP